MRTPQEGTNCEAEGGISSDCSNGLTWDFPASTTGRASLDLLIPETDKARIGIYEQSGSTSLKVMPILP